jgi:hypothetical protein
MPSRIIEIGSNTAKASIAVKVQQRALALLIIRKRVLTTSVMLDLKLPHAISVLLIGCSLLTIRCTQDIQNCREYEWIDSGG